VIQPSPMRRSRSDVWLGGVLGGLARRWEIPVGRLRIAYLVISILSAAFPGILIYCVLWVTVPREDAV
jgi:phage shock protein C